MTRLNQQFTLPDGRRLGYDEHGELDGHPIFYFHGTPSARVEWAFFATPELVQSLHLRVIAVDRPGLGRSDFQSHRRMTDWPQDVCALANHLRLDHFAVIGYSGGSPYAAACAALIPERLSAVGLVGVIGPFDRPELTAGIPPQNLRFLNASRDRPWLARLIQRMMSLLARLAPDRMIAQALTALPLPDQLVLAQPKARQAFLTMLQEAVRSGTRGPQVDSALMVSPWGFDPTTISIPVYLWKGAKDQNAPLAMAHYLSGAIPLSRLTVYPDDGHLSIIANHAEEIFTTIAGTHQQHLS